MSLPNLLPKLPYSAINNPALPSRLPMLDISQVGATNAIGGGMSGIGGIGDAVSSVMSAISPKDDINAKFMERNKDIQRSIESMSGVSSGLSKAALSSGNPIAMGVGALMMGGSALTKSATDEFGVIEEGEKGKAILGSILNPIEGLPMLFNQKKRLAAKNKFINTETNANLAEGRQQGNIISNSIPKYTPPAYGKFGRKLTKFTR
jgi:hypothetical protein